MSPWRPSVRTYVRLCVGAEKYALLVENVLEVVARGPVTVLPGTPAEVLGVRGLRGQILPVINLGLLLGGPGVASQAHLVVAEVGARKAGLAVDEVNDVASLPEPTEETDSNLLQGGLLDGDDLVGVIDVRAVFDAVEQACL
jgi:purine-binding chemotaxis protein CheW